MFAPLLVTSFARFAHALPSQLPPQYHHQTCQWNTTMANCHCNTTTDEASLSGTEPIMGRNAIVGFSDYATVNDQCATWTPWSLLTVCESQSFHAMLGSHIFLLHIAHSQVLLVSVLASTKSQNELFEAHSISCNARLIKIAAVAPVSA